MLLLEERRTETIEGGKVRVAVAVAERWVRGLGEVSTMVKEPVEGWVWVRVGDSPIGEGGGWGWGGVEEVLEGSEARAAFTRRICSEVMPEEEEEEAPVFCCRGH